MRFLKLQQILEEKYNIRLTSGVLPAINNFMLMLLIHKDGICFILMKTESSVHRTNPG